LPFGRRRPIVRAAAVGTVAYQASKRGAAAGQEQAEEQAHPADAPPPPQAAPPPPADSSDPTVEKIKQLAELHASGALTDEEFAAAKAKALGIG
jgi:Short C-terminal domain